jgi:hypothetical protein
MAEDIRITQQPVSTMAQAWFGPLLEHGSTFAADNLRTELSFLQVENLEFPLSCNDHDWDNSWVCSPWTHYISCGQEETERYAPGWAAKLLRPLWRSLGGWLQRAEFNRVVMVNNWLLSTVPWPAWSAVELPALLRTLTERWPNHAVVLRSLNAQESAPLLLALSAAGALIIPSRQVWWFPPESAVVAASRDFRKDVKLLQREDLQLVAHEELVPEDFGKLRQLYAQLYLEKYSTNNQRFTIEWLQHLHQTNLLHFTALRQPGGNFVGVEAYAQHHGILTSPVVGYDLSLPQTLGLYRRLAVIPLLASRRLGMPLNMSAGVGKFKAARGGIPTMEYMAVLAGHLPPKRQRPWQAIQQVSEHLLAPAVRRWNL